MTEYPNLAAKDWLAGGGNDVELMGQLLVERFGFAAANVRPLREGNDAAKLPTRAKFERERSKSKCGAPARPSPGRPI